MPGCVKGETEMYHEDLNGLNKIDSKNFGLLYGLTDPAKHSV